MKKEINIFTNIDSKIIINNIFFDIRVTIKKIEDLKNLSNDIGGLIIYNKPENGMAFNFNILKNNYLLMTNNSEKIQINTNIELVKGPIEIDKIRNKVNAFLIKKTKEYGDIKIEDKQITNSNNGQKVYLTDIEHDILAYLIAEGKSSKHDIKKYVLHLKKNIETNSLDSHLTRIRKKLDKIDSAVSLKSRSDSLLIKFNQKMLD